MANFTIKPQQNAYTVAIQICYCDQTSLLGSFIFRQILYMWRKKLSVQQLTLFVPCTTILAPQSDCFHATDVAQWWLKITSQLKCYADDKARQNYKMDQRKDARTLWTSGGFFELANWQCKTLVLQMPSKIQGEEPKNKITLPWVPTHPWFYSWTRLDYCESLVIPSSIHEQDNYEFWVVSATATFFVQIPIPIFISIPFPIPCFSSCPTVSSYCMS